MSSCTERGQSKKKRSQQFHQSFGPEQLEVILLLSKIEKTTSRRGFGTGLLSRLEHGKLNIPIRHPSGDIAQAIEFSSLEFKVV